MKQSQRDLVEQIARRILGEEKVNRYLNEIPFHDLGFGYDQFGMERESAVVGYLLARVVYDKYFRVESRGHENIPGAGRAIVAANHSGMLPYDGMMVAVDMLERCDPPRAMRAVVDNFVGALPYIGLAFARCGQVPGHRRNFEELLKMDEVVVVFPEGTKGIGKPFRERYQLKQFNVGHVELALLHGAPIVPCAVVGAEEQAPILFKSTALAKLFGIPYVPITPTFPLLGPLGALPYPVKYHVYYGERLDFHREYGPDAVHHPEVVRRLADEVQEQVQQMINDGLKERKGIFR